MPAPRVGILWAEDSTLDRDLIATALQSIPEAPRVRFVEDGERALEELDALNPCLVVLDVKMPRVGGIEALRRIRAAAQHKGLPVVMFTSSSQARDLESAHELGVLEYLQKPLDFAGLERAVQRVATLAIHAQG